MVAPQAPTVSSSSWAGSRLHMTSTCMRTRSPRRLGADSLTCREVGTVSTRRHRVPRSTLWGGMPPTKWGHRLGSPAMSTSTRYLLRRGVPFHPSRYRCTGTKQESSVRSFGPLETTAAREAISFRTRPEGKESSLSLVTSAVIPRESPSRHVSVSHSPTICASICRVPTSFRTHQRVRACVHV